eukprot:10289839-Heterocapsa_arctica.AAC.1
MARLRFDFTLLREKCVRNSRLTVLTQAVGSWARCAMDRNLFSQSRRLSAPSSSASREDARFRGCAASMEPRPWPCRRRSSSWRARSGSPIPEARRAGSPALGVRRAVAPSSGAAVG